MDNVIDDVIKLRKKLYNRSLNDKIALQTSQFNLKQTFKPIIEQSKENTEKIINEAKKEELINNLNMKLINYYKVMNVLKGKSDLNEEDKYIINKLSIQDDEDDTSKLVDQYSTSDDSEWFDLATWFEGLREENIKELFEEQENKDKLLQYLELYQPKLSTKTFRTIRRELPEFYNEIRKVKTGKGIKFLSSDPKELLKKLNILIAEKKAGNNNVLNEISAIADELRRMGIFNIEKIKEINKWIKL